VPARNAKLEGEGAREFRARLRGGRTIGGASSSRPFQQGLGHGRGAVIRWGFSGADLGLSACRFWVFYGSFWGAFGWKWLGIMGLAASRGGGWGTDSDGLAVELELENLIAHGRQFDPFRAVPLGGCEQVAGVGVRGNILLACSESEGLEMPAPLAVGRLSTVYSR